jgi:hypothetical protein
MCDSQTKSQLDVLSLLLLGLQDWTFVHNDIFARTQIDPSALVQRLELDQRSVVSLKRGEFLPLESREGSLTVACGLARALKDDTRHDMCCIA